MKLEPANIVCPTCGNSNYMRYLSGPNVGHLDLKCINCNSYFNFDELYKQHIEEALKPKPLTNEDRIRSMTDEELMSIADDAVFAIEELARRNEQFMHTPLPAWIPVGERLPNENGEYIVSGKDKVWVCEFMMLGDVGGWRNSARNPCVKYWMPLPKPPKEESK